MKDLISKSKVCEILADLYPTDGEKIILVKDLDKAYDKILALPYAEPERKKGRWILKKKLVPLARDASPLNWDEYDETTHSEWKELYYCSSCDYEAGDFEGGDFCSNCGASMRG